MPSIPWKNSLYRHILPILGKKPAKNQIASFHSNGMISSDEQKKLLDVFKKHYVIGCSISIFDKGEIKSTINYGYEHLPDTMVGSNTMFRLASITKLIVTLGALSLIEENNISLEEDIRPFFEGKLYHPLFEKVPITLYQLLTHTSGIIDGKSYLKSLSEFESLGKLLNSPDNFAVWPPGERFAYSNFAFGLLGSLIELISNKSLQNYMKEKIFEPFAMENTTFDLSSLTGHVTLADGYNVLSKKIRKAELVFDGRERLVNSKAMSLPNPYCRYMYGAGGLYSTSASIIKALNFFYNKGAPIISEKTFDSLFVPSIAHGETKPNFYQAIGFAKILNFAPSMPVLWGHQGFAYGVAQGIFYNPSNSKGFVCLNSGCSLYRVKGLSALSRDLIIRLLK